MANLNVENLSKIIQSGNTQEMFTGTLQESASEVGKGAEAGKTFSDVLKDSMEKVNTYQNQADTAVKELIAGRNKNIHETMLTVERADTSLKLMMQVRNKILDAYKEIMRMQV